MKAEKIVPVQLVDVIHIDNLIKKCGRFTTDTELNNGYGCTSELNTEASGCCHVFACPIATELTEEYLESWMEEGHWLEQHSAFDDQKSMCLNQKHSLEVFPHD